MIFVLSKVWGFFGKLGWDLCKIFKRLDKEGFGIWCWIVYFCKELFKVLFDLLVLFLFVFELEELFNVYFKL